MLDDSQVVVVSDPQQGAAVPSEPSAPPADYPTYDEVRAMVDEVLAAVDSSASDMGAGFASIAADSVVTIDPAQWDALSKVTSSQLVGTVVVSGLVSVLVGLLFVLIVTLHWKAR